VPYQKQPGEFQEYDPLAPEVAEYVIHVIQMYIPNVTVENIGSTAVPGCSGRAVIDLIILYSHESIEPILAGLDALGFQWVQRINVLPEEWPNGAGAIHYQDRLFRLHIHVQTADHSSVVEKRVFRDRLRSDPELLIEYMARKQAILATGTVNPINYTAAKASFVLQALEPSAR
jgi:GrpB-like predicted nucleotidyltransferase (UPF0157 family)